MTSYNIVAATDESTVVAEYEPSYSARGDTYQSEAELEQEFIRMLTGQRYEYLKIKDEAALIKNLRRQLELLNSYKFSDNEWSRFFSEYIANLNESIVDKTRKIQDDHVQILKCDEGVTTRNAPIK